ncbi:MAG TPA: oxidoreductase, partial [Rikenellaceae bacterium]|nr:oxidoreductase [Rikenellaceae bacterium]
MERAVIVGATSGIGREVAQILLKKGWHVGIAGRREDILRQMKALQPQAIEYQVID